MSDKKRVTFRVTEDVYELIEYTAKLEGMTINQFITSACVKHAKEGIEFFEKFANLKEQIDLVPLEYPEEIQ